MDFLKYDEDTSGSDWISSASLCVVEYTYVHLGFQNHTEMVNTVETTSPGRDLVTFGHFYVNPSSTMVL